MKIGYESGFIVILFVLLFFITIKDWTREEKFILTAERLKQVTQELKALKNVECERQQERD